MRAPKRHSPKLIPQDAQGGSSVAARYKESRSPSPQRASHLSTPSRSPRYSGSTSASLYQSVRSTSPSSMSPGRARGVSPEQQRANRSASTRSHRSPARHSEDPTYKPQPSSNALSPAERINAEKNRLNSEQAQPRIPSNLNQMHHKVGESWSNLTMNNSEAEPSPSGSPASYHSMRSRSSHQPTGSPAGSYLSSSSAQLNNHAQHAGSAQQRRAASPQPIPRGIPQGRGGSSPSSWEGSPEPGTCDPNCSLEPH